MFQLTDQTRNTQKKKKKNHMSLLLGSIGSWIVSSIGVGGGLYWLYNRYVNQPLPNLKAPSKTNGNIINFESCILRPNKIVPGQPVRRALTIGINYTGTSSALLGCINDSNNIKRILANNYKYNEILQLTDDTPITPTGDNIIYAFRWLMSGLQDGQELYFHYSGHGSQKNSEKYKTNRNVEAIDDALVPLDYKSTGLLIDDIVNDELVDTLQGYSIKFTCVVDACHSGTMLDLPFIGNISPGFKMHATSYDINEPVNALTMKPNILFLSGCLDSETSGDLSGDNQAPRGALTSSFIKILNQYGFKPTVNQLFIGVHKDLVSQQISQRPELGSNRPLDPSAMW